MNNLKERITHMIDEQQLGIKIQEELTKREAASIPPPGLVPGPTYGRVIRVHYKMNVRSSPNFNDNVIGQLSLGATVLIIGEEGAFYRLDFPGYKAAYAVKTKIQIIGSSLPEGAGEALTGGQIAALSTAAYLLLS